MSMMRCTSCSNLIDTDLDVECWVDYDNVIDGTDRCLCPACRERFYAEVYAETSPTSQTEVGREKL